MLELKMPKKSVLITLICAAAVLLLIAGAIITFFANKFHIEIAMDGEKEITLEFGQEYTDLGASARYCGTYFMKDGKAVELKTEGSVDAKKLGSYTITYSAEKWGQSAKETRTVTIIDTAKPTLKLKGEEKVTILRGKKFEEPGFTAEDNYDGDLTQAVKVDGKVDTEKAGTYTLTYTVADSSGNNAAELKRTVVVRAPVAVAPAEPIQVIPGEKTIYLTFDDGPGPYTAKLLDILKQNDVKATFFVCDHSNYNHLLSRMAQEGHAIGIHSASHDYDKIYASEDAFFNDFYHMQDLIESKAGIKTTLCRFPGGSSNLVSRFNPGIMTRLSKELTNRGFQYFDWNVSSGDAGETTSTAQVVRNVTRGASNKSVSVVLQHDIKNFSVNAVQEIINWGKANGYTFKALSASAPTAHHGINN